MPHTGGLHTNGVTIVWWSFQQHSLTWLGNSKLKHAEETQNDRKCPTATVSNTWDDKQARKQHISKQGIKLICSDHSKPQADPNYTWGLAILSDSLFFSVNNILAGLWLNYISSVEITLFLLADILLQHRALFQC